METRIWVYLSRMKNDWLYLTAEATICVDKSHPQRSALHWKINRQSSWPPAAGDETVASTFAPQSHVRKTPLLVCQGTLSYPFIKSSFYWIFSRLTSLWFLYNRASRLYSGQRYTFTMQKKDGSDCLNKTVLEEDVFVSTPGVYLSTPSGLARCCWKACLS